MFVNKEARVTRFDPRNYSASRHRDTITCQLIRIVHNGLVQAPIKSLDEIKLRDKDGEIITQAWLDHILGLMNGFGRIEDPEDNTAVKFTGRNLQESVIIVVGVQILNLSIIYKVVIHKNYND